MKKLINPPPHLVMLYPTQLWMAEVAGWVRGVHYEVYQCLLCEKPMDKCTCLADAARRPH